MVPIIYEAKHQQLSLQRHEWKVTSTSQTLKPRALSKAPLGRIQSMLLYGYTSTAMQGRNT